MYASRKTLPLRQRKLNTDVCWPRVGSVNSAAALDCWEAVLEWRLGGGCGVVLPSGTSSDHVPSWCLDGAQPGATSVVFGVSAGR